MFKVEDIIKITSYFTKIHHSKGRLRVRVNPKIKNETKDISLSDIESISKKIDGIKSVKIKKIIASITIEYDPNIFAYELWEELLERKNLENILERINRLSKEV